ncbi:hypothetical protein C900_01385 [Fulvivirga imtechensis AK7]|uniref:Uncharacterized protein n=1 Tax=Fulvivirga imtechensis AK7 TaxID=1237149 RepID=L8JYD6_9BACT|nr:hypothetical protein [Fulvivirga imtechensis]ELR73775.1 hypothetical protein C900_01385 [Fulvivirga imtechensis AK7]
MKKLIYIIFLLGIGLESFAQSFSSDPASFTAEDAVTLTFDVTGTSLAGKSDIYLWSWIAEGCSSSCDAPTNINPASSATADAKMTQSESNPNVFTITIIPVDFFDKSPSEMKKIGVLAKGTDWSEGQTADYLLDIEPLTFVPTVDRKFPTKATANDVITLYLDQTLAENLDLKYELADFEVSITAFDSDGGQVGDTVTKDAVNEGDGIHYTRILPQFTFNADNIVSIKYRFISKDNNEVQSDEFSYEFLDLK